MNLTVKQKYKALKKYLKTKLIKDKPVSILDYQDLVTDENKIWTSAINKALEDNACIYIPKGKYFIDSSIIVPSNRRIIAHKDAEICTILSCKKVSLRTDCVIDGSYRVIGDDEPRTENVFIEGGLWSTEHNKRGIYGGNGAYDDEDSLHGVHAGMLFSGVRNLWVKNVKFKHVSTFAIQVGRTENFLIEGLKFDECFADGVHLNGDIKNGVVINCKGEAGDDLVAMNAYDWPNSTINNGSIQDLTVANIISTGREFNLMRLAPGVLSEKDGGIDCFIKNVHISNIQGVCTYKMYLQTPSYVGTPEGTTVGRMENVVFENLKLVKEVPSDGTDNYQKGDPVTGHYGVFELCSNIESVTFKNVNATINFEKYPITAHFMTVGPKSFYIPESNVEVFDPYVNATIKCIYYKNLKINGKKVQDLKDHIKFVEFNNLYPSEYSTGSGKVEKIIKL